MNTPHHATQALQRPPWSWDIPELFNIGVACSDQHLDTPVAATLAMIVEHDQQGTDRMTFAELSRRTHQFAQLLREHDIGFGERVLIRLPNSLDYPTAFLGTMKMGAIAVPTSTLLTAKEVDYLAQDSQAAVLVTDQQTWSDWRAEGEVSEHLRLVLLCDGDDGQDAIDGVTVLALAPALDRIQRWDAPYPTRAQDSAYLVYTSGTTGYPKGVLHAHRSLLGRKPASQYWFDFDATQQDRILHSGKFNWTYVLGSGLMDPLYLGKTVIVYEGRNNAETWVNLIALHEATIFIGVPTIYRQILQKTDFTAQDVPTLRHCMSAGEHLSDEVFTQWEDRFGRKIYEAVGMSEFSYYLSSSPGHEIRPGSAGFPQPGHDIQLLDPDTLTPVPMGEEGMICVPLNDPGLFVSYWRLPEETAKLRHDGWFFTGDYARYDDDGYIWFLGRKDDIIKSFGYRVSPYEIERVLKSHPAVADCACIGEAVGADKLLVVAYVIAHPEVATTADELLVFAQANLASYKAPKVIYLAQELPRTRNGKILRRAITPELARSKSGA
jgi:acyl-coenzyme A synthetase/AMP-(fatty) acid ligase